MIILNTTITDTNADSTERYGTSLRFCVLENLVKNILLQQLGRREVPRPLQLHSRAKGNIFFEQAGRGRDHTSGVTITLDETKGVSEVVREKGRL